VAAVAVWDHYPSAEELLASRLGAGWRPTPSRLKGGEAVLGHAACVVLAGSSGPDGGDDGRA
jgi:hypothetical protein